MSSKRRVTLKDIAEHLGVHLTTVAAALKNRPNISEPTKKRVRAAAEELGYRPDPMLSALSHYSKGSTSLKRGAVIAFVGYNQSKTKSLGQPITRAEYKAAQRRASIYGYEVQYFYVGPTLEEQKQLGKILYNRGIYGLLIAGTTSESFSLELDWQQFSAVCIGFSLSNPAVNRVIPNHFSNIQTILKELKQIGKCRIGLAYKQSILKRSDFLVTASYNAHTLANDLVCFPPLIEEAPTYDTLKQWAKTYEMDAIICSPDIARKWRDSSPDVEWETNIQCYVAFRESDSDTFPGIDENPEEIASAAIDMLSNQIIKNDFGIPKQRRTLAISGLWQDH